MFYQLYELNHALMSPMRATADVAKLYFKNPINPLAHTAYGRTVAAASEVFERLTRRYGKPSFGLTETEIDGVPVKVTERVIWQRPFCRLLHFHRGRAEGAPRQPNMLIVAPLSGHYATLLRGTVETFLPTHEVYITDWADARMVPLAEGRFDLDTYIDYLIELFHLFKGNVHAVAVCQPAVPVFAAVALMEGRGDGTAPRSMTLMGGPIDTRESPTVVNNLAQSKDLDWFKRNVIMKVPFPHPGFMRDVYPGFLQLSGFMSMNLDRHVSAHHEFFNHLVRGDGDSAEKHRDFYDEYMSVMDLTAEFYLQTVYTVFIEHQLPRGIMMHRAERVDPKAVRRTALLTVEGEKDDISGIGQTRAAHALTVNLPADRKEHYEQPGVGHYGVFNGSRFRREIAPRIAAFIDRWEKAAGPRSASAPQPSAAAAANGHDPGTTTTPAEPAPVDVTPVPVEVGSATSAAALTASDALSRTVEADIPALADRDAPDANAPANAAGASADAVVEAAMTSGAASDRAAGAAVEAIALETPIDTPDDLTRLRGIGPRIEQRLNKAGVFHLSQIAALDQSALAALDASLGVRGRAVRENWPEQARRLLAEETAVGE